MRRSVARGHDERSAGIADLLGISCVKIPVIAGQLFSFGDIARCDIIALDPTIAVNTRRVRVIGVVHEARIIEAIDMETGGSVEISVSLDRGPRDFGKIGDLFCGEELIITRHEPPCDRTR